MAGQLTNTPTFPDKEHQNIPFYWSLYLFICFPRLPISCLNVDRKPVTCLEAAVSHCHVDLPSQAESDETRGSSAVWVVCCWSLSSAACQTPGELLLGLWGPCRPHLQRATCSVSRRFSSALLLAPELLFVSDLRHPRGNCTSLRLWVWPSLRIPKVCGPDEAEPQTKCIYLSTHHPLSISLIWTLQGRAKPQWFLQTNWRIETTLNFSRCLGSARGPFSERICGGNIRLKFAFLGTF